VNNLHSEPARSISQFKLFLDHDDHKSLPMAIKEYEPIQRSAGGIEEGRLGGCCGNEEGVLRGVAHLESLHELSDGSTFLTNGNAHTVRLILAVLLPLLVEDWIDSNSSLPGLMATKDQLPSTTRVTKGTMTFRE
jgi:hypothetical protein